MTTYFIDPVNGSNSNNGLGPDASHASNKPFATIGKIIATSGVGVAGDIVYLAPGTYREVVTANITSPASELQILGDPSNAQGFKTSGGVLVASAYVVWSAYTTNDKTAPSATSCLVLNGRDFLTFQDIVFIHGGSGTAILATTATSQSIKLTRCTFLPGSVADRAINITGAGDTALTWTIDSCLFTGSASAGSAINISSGVGSADYNLAVSIKNCQFLGTTGAAIRLAGAASNKPGGIAVFNCTFLGPAMIVATGGSTTIPCTFYNNYVQTGGSALVGTATGEIVEDFNILAATTPRTNVATGTSSKSDGSYASLLEIGQASLYGFAQRPFLTPMAASPLLGFGAQAGGPSVDLYARPRPAGGASTSYAVGALERHQTAAQETSVTQAGSNAIKIIGPGDHDIAIPVDASSTTISIYVRYDTNHGTGNKPQIILQANAVLGVVTETKTATVGVDTWEQLTFSTFTPTAKGRVVVRLTSRAAAGNGIAYFDTEAGGASATSGFDYFAAGEPLSTLVAGGTSGIKQVSGMDGGMRG